MTENRSSTEELTVPSFRSKNYLGAGMDNCIVLIVVASSSTVWLEVAVGGHLHRRPRVFGVYFWKT